MQVDSKKTAEQEVLAFGRFLERKRHSLDQESCIAADTDHPEEDHACLELHIHLVLQQVLGWHIQGARRGMHSLAALSSRVVRKFEAR